LDKEYKELETFKFVTESMNHLALIGAREAIGNLGETNILYYMHYHPDDSPQLFLEYAYLGNRVGYGVRKGILDKAIILSFWLPEWWISLWKKLEPLIKEERKRRNIPKLYGDFEWFVAKLEQKDD